MHSGDLFLEVTSAKQSTSLVNPRKMAHFDITVVPHNSLNFSQDFISAEDLLNVSTGEICSTKKFVESNYDSAGWTSA
ncbi:hypothetical protein TNCT_678451 [Trichonephila clavata]|uniref:Uncharacterized protein n=1 Tax=Trichonephila clavata TaxID=2740835 RepID=A0A8X6LYB5_TRICU|nr:hypothetical protein TNCT_678451 [Trichonephila clavata]